MQLETLLAKLMVEFTKNKSFMHEAVAVSLQANSFVFHLMQYFIVSLSLISLSFFLFFFLIIRNESRFHYSKKASAKTMKALVSSSAELIQTLVDVFTVSDTEISADFKV
ncbi:hypothetical protein YC2023_087322 [Brassica napus]|uniref:(rape) hypothetical protein n=1 Tax=Brassica napus TaxID=3708 RepID=A0A816N875_BRANA|nr:unnamed protein product [Brassica napus]